MVTEPMLGTDSAVGWKDGHNMQQAMIFQECSHNKNQNLVQDMRTTKKHVLSSPDGDRDWRRQTMVVTPELQPPQQDGASSSCLHETTIQMKVTWKGSQDFRTNYDPDPNACALQAAQQELYWSGQQQYHSLRLLANQTLGQRCNAATGWEQLIWGTAIFQVTLLSEPPIQPLDWKAFQQLEKMFGPNGRRQGAAPRESSSSTDDVPHPKVEVTASTPLEAS